MSKLIESFPNWSVSALFTRLGASYPEVLPWANEHGNILDQMYFGNHSGYKESSPLIDKFIELNNDNVLTENQIDILVNIIYVKYNVQWDKLYKVLSAEYNPIENYSMVEEETPDLVKTETPNITKNKTTKTASDFTVKTDNKTNADIYGFNSTTPVPQAEGGADSTVNTKGDAEKNVVTEDDIESGTREYTETGKRTLTRSGNIGVTTSQQMLESEIKLWQWNFYETVFRNVDEVLTSPKYNIYRR